MTSYDAPILETAEELGLSATDIELFGRQKAKVDLAAVGGGAGKGAGGRLVLVSAINPTPAGEGKTTTSIGLAMGLRRAGKRVALALREPSLGPVFGVKGGGTGGGKASLTPAEDINLHFTGDLHAITSAHNLLSALVDNMLHFGTPSSGGARIDSRRVTWGRVLDMNDRALRQCNVGLGGPTFGVPREDRFDITAASEIMAIVALAESYEDLEQRLSRIVVAGNKDGSVVRAGDIPGAPNAMTALLRDALKPNLVRTLEGGPAFVHAGPFANIAHGCNSVLATRMAMRSADYVVTEAGFGFDLGGEKFLDIKARRPDLWPRLIVLVATLRALKMHGGVDKKKAAEPNPDALARGMAHLEHHLATIRAFGLPAVVAINAFPGDPAGEIDWLASACRERGAEFAISHAFAKGGEGALELADRVVSSLDAGDAEPPKPAYTYSLTQSIEEKVDAIAKRVYGARGVAWSSKARDDIERLKSAGDLPICMAKTQLSLSDDPRQACVPKDFDIAVRELRWSAGAGFIVALTGDMMTMPGLPRVPAAVGVKLMPDGTIRGLMQNE